jgi:hypothetical protein
MEGAGNRRHDIGLADVPAVHSAVEDHPDDLVGLFVKTIIGSFVLNIQDDEQEGADSESQPQDVDRGGGLVPPAVAEGDGEKVFEHVCQFDGLKISPAEAGSGSLSNRMPKIYLFDYQPQNGIGEGRGVWIRYNRCTGMAKYGDDIPDDPQSSD